MKKIISLFMVIIMSISMIPNETIYGENYAGLNLQSLEDECNFTNLIVFARFSDEEEFVNNEYSGNSVRKITDNSYNNANFNVSDYYETASNGKLHMNSVYLFDKGGSIQLSHPRGYYAEYSDENPEGYTDNGERSQRMYELKTDWSDAINRVISAGNVITNYDGTKKYNFSELDKNNDGAIDAITIIYKNTTQNISVSWASPLWNYQDYADYVKINADGKTITSKNYVQLTNSYDYLYKDNQENVILPMAVATHEMGHILGFKDLYNSSNSSPVYYMSAMARHMSPVPQFISVKEREAMGWLTSDNVKTIYQNGQYTLKEAATRGDSQTVGYKLNLKGINKTLYLEYRNFGTDGNKYDCQSKELYKTDGTKLKGLAISSGLVCYLVDKDTKFPNNMGCVAGKWNYETLGGTYATKSDAPLKLNQILEITDDMYVEVTNITDNQLTFKIEGDFEEQQPETTEPKEIADREKYDGRDDGIVTPVKDQGDTNLCWAYSSIAAAESSILKSGFDPKVTKDTLSLNPVAAAYRVFKRESDPLGNTDGEWQSVNYLMQSGDPLKIARLYSMWWAPVSGDVVTTNPYDNPTYRFENAIYIPENKSNPEEYIRSIKKAIAKYGAVTFQYNNARETLYYNPKNEQGSTISPHACTIIGWDDNIPSDKFVPNGATKKGGWLVKNSYKSLEYFWLSYDNTSSCSYAFSFAPKDKYDFNYYYDGSMDDFPLRNDKSVANVFEAQKSDDSKDEYIKAVNVAIGGENVTATVEIYKNVDYPYGGQDNVPVSGGYLANTTTAYFENSGYVTIELNQPVKIEKGQWFSAIVSVSNEKGDAKIMTSYKNGREMSYINNGSGWTKLKNYVGRIKVYTKLENKVEKPTTEVTTAVPTTQVITKESTTVAPTTEVPTTEYTTAVPKTEVPTTESTTEAPTTEVTTTLAPTTEKQTETSSTVESTTELLTTENTTLETTAENKATDETTTEKETTTTGQVVTKENEPTTNGKTTTGGAGVNKKSLKQTKILKIKKLKNRKVRITFKKVSKAKIYQIQYSTDRKFKKNVRTKRTGKNTYLLRKLRLRKRYYVRVRAISGRTKGKWSKARKFRI